MLKISDVSTLVVAASALGLAGCNPVSVRTDYARDVSVSTCHTYAFAHEHVANGDQPAAYANPLNAERLRSSIQAHMAARGIQPVADGGAADCVLGYALGSRQTFDDYYGGIGAGFGWGGFYGSRGWGGWGGSYGYGWDGPWVQNEVRIAVDLFDGHTHKPIWHASASQNTSELAGARAEVKINEATDAIFQKFPAAGPGGRTT